MSSSAPVEEGQILAGKYRVDRILGQGGMGVVVAARHIQLDEVVAIKFLLPEVLENAEAVERFSREARASIKIKSEHVVRVMDVGTMDGGIPYMVMEYLKGGDLSALLQSRGGPLTVPEAAEYLLQACEAIADAHVLGIVHRDLKPANLFLTQRSDGTPCVKVLDFGISKITGPNSGLQMTKTSTVMGSPLYMSPEQMASSKDVDARSDIWSLGAILYELLTNTQPFLADTLPQVCAMILQNDPPSIRAGRPDVPEALEQVAFKCLAKRREDRYQSVAELAVALADFAPRHARASAERVCRVLSVAGVNLSNTALPPSSAPPANATTGPGMTAGNWSTSTGSSSSKGKTALFAGLAIGGVLLAGVAVGAVVLFGKGSTQAPASGVVEAPTAQPVPSEIAPIATPSVATAAPLPAAATAAPSADEPKPASPPTSTASRDAGTRPVATAKPPPAGGKQPGGGRGLDLFNDNK